MKCVEAEAFNNALKKLDEEILVYVEIDDLEDIEIIYKNIDFVLLKELMIAINAYKDVENAKGELIFKLKHSRGYKK